MVLHLLGKKSWNVYNADNIERVRRDEAQAAAREEAAEQRMQEEDAARRIAILRGEPVPAISALSEDTSDAPRRRAERERPVKRRRLRGEDDTDRDIRHAREDAEAGARARQTLLKHSNNKNAEQDVPLHDPTGHIQLITPPSEKPQSSDKSAKKREADSQRERDEDQGGMRFSDAAGFKKNMEKPWYTSSRTATGAETTTARDSNNTTIVLSDVQDKDVWGNQDPLRRERERARISTNDPFAAMQQAQRQLKQSEADRERWRKERLVEVEELTRADERKRCRHRSERERQRAQSDGESLEDFRLDDSMREIRDGGGRDKSERRHRKHHHRHRSHRDRSRSPSRDKTR